mgnify:FL=1
MPPGLYVHVPFCRSKCTYCDFYSITRPAAMAAWLTALAAEIALVQGQDWSQPFDTLYLGGGTPSLLPAEVVSAVFDLLRQSFPLTADAEITLEANPDDVTPAKLHLWQQLGVNRLSLGVQSLDDAELRWLGRRHNAAQARRALELAREAGFVNLSVDLIDALPGQTQAGWLATLEGILAYQPEHLSCYQLTLEKNTPLGKSLARGEFQPASAEDQRAFFLLTSEHLEARGYLHYEVSNFARGEHYVARHNSKYWQHAPYLGLGPAAHSFDGRRRRWNVSSVAACGRLLQEGRAPLAGAEVLNDAQLHLETLALGLRTRQGVALAAFEQSPQAKRLVSEFCAAGLLEVDQEWVRPTPAGLVVADSLAWFLSD